MEIKLQKRKHNALKKLTKVDVNNNLIEGQEEIFVRVEEVPDNLINTDATPLSEDVFNKINWKDGNALLFKQVSSLPSPISGVTQIVSLNNGQIWCVPGTDTAPFQLGNEDISSFLKKNFQSYEALTLLGSGTKVGALPVDYTTTGNSNPSTYLDITDGSIAFKINGVQKHILNSDKASFTHGKGEICINDSEIALKHHTDKTTIGLINGSFYIKGNNTQISEDLTNNKLNFYTLLDNAVYGNKDFYLEFFTDKVRLKTANEEVLFTIRADGKVYTADKIYASGTNEVIDSSSVNGFIKDYLDTDFRSRFMECYADVSTSKTTIFEGCSYYAYYNISGDSALYQIDFSDTQTGTVMSIYFNGVGIDDLEKVYKSETGYHYLVSQYYAVDDSEDDYIRVLKYTSTGESLGIVYIRGLYRL